MSRLSGKTAIVTGAARGIGNAIATRFAAEGARVILADQDREAVETAAAAINQQAACIDVSVRAEVQALVEAAENDWGKIDILVNNAGIFSTASLLELQEQEFDRVLAVNLKSTLFGIQAVAPGMMARRSGAIVNVASIAARLGAPGTLAYGVSKAGIVQMTNIAALELAPFGVRVNALGPGTFATEMSQLGYRDEEARKTVLSRIPMGRLGDPAEAAGVVLFLASDDAAYVTGKTLYADGGRMGLNLTMPTAKD